MDLLCDLLLLADTPGVEITHWKPWNPGCSGSAATIKEGRPSDVVGGRTPFDF